MQLHRLAIPAAAFALAGLSTTAAQAVVVNIDATTSASASVSQSFAAGTYNISIIGTAQGGLYDGWTYKSGSLYREAFSFTLDGTTYSVDLSNGGTTFNGFANTGGAQTAFASGPYAVYAGATDGNLLYTVSTLSLTLTDPTTAITFSVPDYYFDDNAGGVSLSVTSAVPEPETYALLLAGLGAMGFVARRRRAA